MTHPESQPRRDVDPARPAAAHAAATPRRPWHVLPLDLARGALIGMAELVPGVSGGTVALVTGVYDQLIDSADHIVQAGRRLVFGPDRLRSAAVELRRTNWLLIIPVLIGMVAAVFTLAGVMKGFVTDTPEHARGLFFGLVAASVIVPLRMLPGRKPGRPAFVEWLMLAGAVVVAFVLTSLAGGRTVNDPALPLVFLAAAVAICALVVPGISGSFFLLAVGLYAPTLAAVDERNLPYLGTFLLGAVAGLAAFVKVLHHLLHNHRRSTLIIMAGLMIGSLRALWPWQTGGVDGDGAGALLAPGEPLWGPIGLAVLGAVVVLLLVVVEERLKAGPAQHREVEPDMTI